MACNIEAVKELISDLSKNTNAKLVPVVAKLEAALKDMELMKILNRKTGGATTIDKAGITAEMYELGQEIQDLYTNAEYADGTELDQINADIEKVTKKMESLYKKLGIKGTVGDRILSNEPARRFVRKEATADEIVRLRDYFEAKMVGNNLNISEDLFGEDFDMLKENVDVNVGEETYFDGAKTQTLAMIDAVNTMVKEQFNHSTIDKVDVEEATTVNRFQSISRLLLQGAPKTDNQWYIDNDKGSKDGYTLPKEVVTAIALASNDWLVTEAALRADRRTDDDTKRLLSKAPGEDLSLEEKNRVADVDGFVANAATSIGGVVYKNLGLKVKAKEGENRELLEGKLKTELGLIALASMENDGRIVTEKKGGEEIFGKGNDTTNGKGVNVFRYTEEGSLLVDDRTQLFAPNSRFANKIVGTETNMRTPSFAPPKAPRKVKTSSEAGEFFTVAQESQDAVNAQEEQSWEFDTDFVDSYRDMIKDEADRERLKKLLGYKDPAKAHLELRAGINGKNAQIESNMQYLEELYNQMEVSEEPKMWFPWKFVKNGRFILDTNTFNPQGKKLHRFAVFANEAKVTKKNDDMQILALAMAFGADVDKRSLKTSKKTWIDIKAKLDEMMDAGKSDLDILEAFNDGVEVFDHKDGADTTTSVHPHDTEHAMGGLAEYRRYRAHVAANGTHIGMTSRLPLETDAITSGYILKTLQIPLLGVQKLKGAITDVVDALKKGGIFTPDSKYQDYGKQSESGDVDDAYNTPAKVMKGLIKPIQEKLLDNNTKDPEYAMANRTATELALGLDVGKELNEISRKFMKAPFMTFNYGSGLSNIVNSIGDFAVESLYKMMADPKKTAQVQGILDAAIRGSVYDSKAKIWTSHSKGQAEVEAFAKKFASATPTQRLEMKLPTVVSDNIKSNIAAGVGAALEETFRETYGVYIDAGNDINASFTTMFRLFKAKVDVAIDAKQLELGKDGKRRHLTSKETNDIIKTMASSLPAIQTALANEDKLAKVMIYKTESTFFDNLDGDVIDNGQGRLKLKKGDLSAQSKTYQLIEAASSGAVVPIHYLDGSIQAIVANSGVSALGVHDAWMFNIDEAMSGTRTYNEGTARVSSEYSLTEAIISGLNESINNATPEEIAAVDAQYLAEHQGKPEDATNVNLIHTDMDNLYIASEKAREQLFNNDLRFEHAALEGSSHVRPAGYTKKERSIELNTEKGTITGKAADAKKPAPKKVEPVKPVETPAEPVQDIAAEIAAVNKGKPAEKHTAKELKKVELATQYIGIGSANSSTARYAEVYGDKANTGEYTKDDAVWVSSNGKRKGRVDPVVDGKLANGYQVLDKAIEAGATIIMDTQEHVERTMYYNIGEVQLAQYMLDAGYTLDSTSGAGVWTKKVVKRDKTVTPETPVKTATGLRWLNNKENVIIDKMGNPKVTITSTEDLTALSKDYADLLRERGLITEGVDREDSAFVAGVFADLSNEIFGKTKVTVKFDQHMGKDNLMGYATGKDLKLATGAQFTVDPMKVVLHEFAHTITSDQLKKNPIIDKRVTAMREKAIALGLDKDPLTSYAMVNNAEFLAEAISNPYFQASLKAIKTDGKSTLLTQVKTVFKNLLKRAKADGSLDNALGDVLDVVIDLQTGKATVNAETTVASEAVPWDEDPVVEPEPKKPVVKKPKTAPTGTYELFPGVQTNEGQTAAIDSIKEWYRTNETSFLVKGRGGTGKTTIVNKVLEELGLHRTQVMFATPTNKAKVVISIANKKSTYGDIEYHTTSGLLNYGEDTSKTNADGTVHFVKKTGPWVPKVEDKLSGIKVLVIDEASMLNSKLKREMEEEADNAGVKIIYMGDNVQLPPVKDLIDGVPIRESTVFAEHADGNIAILDERMRQGEESPILPVTDSLAHSIETGGDFNVDVSKASKGSELENNTDNESKRVEAFIEAYKEDPAGSRWIWYNAQANPKSVKLVNIIRGELFGNEALDRPFVKDEQVYVADAYTHETPGKKQVIYNGMEAEVTAVNYDGTVSAVYGKKGQKTRVKLPVITATLKDNLTGEVFKDVPVFTEDTRAEIVRLQEATDDFGQKKSMGALYSAALKNVSFAGVINAHKSQGSTYNTVFVDVGNVMDQTLADTDSKLKALYVATSRPKKKLVLMNMPTGKPVKKPTPTKVPKPTSTQPVVGDNTTSPAILNMIRSIGKITNMPVRAKLITENKVKFASNPEVMAMLADMETDQGNAYIAPLDNKENPAIITDNIQSPKAQELGIDIDKAIAAEYKHAENAFKKCNK